MSQERLVGEVPVVRFELEYADGRIRRLLGEDAEAWKSWLDGAAAMAENHNILAPRGMKWIDIPTLGEPRGRTKELVTDDSPPGPIQTSMERALYDEYLGVDFGEQPSRVIIAGAAVKKLDLHKEPRGKTEVHKTFDGPVAITMPPLAPVEAESLTLSSGPGVQAAYQMGDEEDKS